MNDLKSKHIILGSQSPRRRNLLKELGLKFEVRAKDTDEDFDPEMPSEGVAPYLAAIKANAFIDELQEGDLLITADTTVILKGKIINKPQDRLDSIAMLGELSNKMHSVVTGVCLKTIHKTKVFSCKTDVYFKELERAEIEYYVDKFEPYDKAGSYGIQEWLGYIGIEKIDGCFFNVMGLPLQKLYQELKAFE